MILTTVFVTIFFMGFLVGMFVENTYHDHK